MRKGEWITIITIKMEELFWNDKKHSLILANSNDEHQTGVVDAMNKTIRCIKMKPPTAPIQPKTSPHVLKFKPQHRLTNADGILCSKYN